MKKILSVLLSAVMLITLAGCGSGNDSSAESVNSEPVSSAVDQSSSAESDDGSGVIDDNTETVGFHVDGTKLLDANGNEFVFRGVNHSHSWFTGNDGVALDAIAATGANSVRLVLSDGEQWTRDTVEGINALIEKCKELKMVAILEVHDATGYDDIESLEKAADFWIEVKDALIGNEDYVILNIANEWMGKSESKTWAKGYKSVIPKLREAGIRNLIMVDSSGWGQYGKCIKEKGKEVFESDPMGNIIFSVHMYGSAGGTAKKISKNLEYATEQDLCVCVGEFGYTHSDGDVDEDYLMQYCAENSIGYLGWSWKGNSGGVEYLDIATEWDGSVLSADWGEKLINGENGIKATSKICSVFE